MSRQRPQPCTGVAAVYCPNCGDCACPDPDDLNDPNCPLHAPKSMHATGPIR